ncbi:hypothetical protein [Photobacterium sp. 1_MG-2023]|uniref:hypothetical protein n=1 Tax=Photobacterium sp. 1_MG-2023 TaxID=3062646 RepID=UPI0026E16F1F|nr:hypothetical protein [Photobacterium sp. 1_MG-2023]MDO6708799.1 hypothetical protein [Photobacterium sp. 1_MG-2023]
MAKKHRPQARKIAKQSNVKPTQPKNEEGAMIFSFKHLQLEHPQGKFCIKAKDGNYLSKFLGRLKDVSQQKANELRQSGGKALRAHTIDWEHTSEKSGFNHLNEQLQALTPYQFQLSANEHGRIHGFFIDNVFYAVWLDPNHELYP